MNLEQANNRVVKAIADAKSNQRPLLRHKRPRGTWPCFFLKKAEKNGCETINGISMLVIQALTSYIDWTGREIELDEMGLAISKKIMDIKEKQ